MTHSRKEALPLRILKMLGGIALGLILAALFYLTAILGQPHDVESDAGQSTQPPVAASPAFILEYAEQLQAMIEAFPVPVLAGAPGNSLTLVSGVSRDAAFEGHFGRILTLRYQDADGHKMEVISVYPARALTLLPTEGLRLTGETEWNLAGYPAVRMTGRDSSLLYTQTSEGLYAAVIQGASKDVIAQLIRPLQLWSSPSPTSSGQGTI